jgi:hypothetical protein
MQWNNWLMGTLMVGLALAAAVAQGETVVRLDDFEDGSDSGWQLVGHGSLMGQYHKQIVSPGCKSAYALRLSKGTAEGWCGLGTLDLTRLGLTRCDGIRLMARGARNVTGILVDAQLSDGSRWWYKASLAADGAWTTILATPERFSPVENPGKAARPDLAKIRTLWLTLDSVAEKSAAPWEMEIDDVVLLGTVGASATTAPARAPRTGPAKPPVYAGPSCRVVVLDGEAFRGVRSSGNVATGLDWTLRRAGLKVTLATPQALAPLLDADAVDLLILTGPAYLTGDERRILELLKRGRALWYIGTAPPLSEPMVAAGAGFKAAPDYRPPTELKWILDAVPQGRHFLELTAPQMELTSAGQKWWPELPATLPVGKCAFLAANDSISWPSTPPWVEVTPLLQVTYESRNWIFENDRFTGWVMVLLRHRSGPFAGARILYSGLARDNRSILAPAHPDFAQVAVKCVEELAKPVTGRWPSVPPAPLAGLPELTRANFLHYPGPVLAPLNIGGFDLAEGTTVGADLNLIGFNAIHIEVPWLEQMDASGAVIDFAKADAYMRFARDQRKRVVWDPYDFNWGRFQWTGPQTVANPQFRARFTAGMKALVARYQQDPTLVAVMATPHTGTSGFAVDKSEPGRLAWQTYVRESLKLSLAEAGKRYGKPLRGWDELPLPEHRSGAPYNLGPLWADYLDFFSSQFHNFMRQVITAVRSEIPDLPVLMRGPYLEVGLGMRVAAEFKDVALHCECVETTPDVEGYYRSLALSFGVPITGENGWPKSRGGPMRMALADWLLGGYRAGLYSFAGPTFARPSMLDFHQYELAAREIGRAAYPVSDLALLVPDTTLYASEPPNFFSMEKLAHLEFAFERFGFPFRAVSSQFLDLKGVRILVDDGSNLVLTPAARRQLAQWVRDGGTLVAFPQTGAFDLAGGSDTLARDLGLSFAARREAIPVGKGRVVVLPNVPVSDSDLGRLEKLLAQLGARRDVQITPQVNNACFVNGDGRRFLVLFAKSSNHVGAFFRESRLAEVEAALPDLNLQVRPAFPFRRARNVVTGQAYAIKDGAFAVPLPKTTWVAIELLP